VRLFSTALLECRLALEKDPTNPALMMKIKAMQIQSWHDHEKFEESYEGLRRLCKEIELLKNVIAATSQKRVEEVALKFPDSGMPVEDLIQEGNLGLTKAIESFDFDLGSNFLASNYTYRMIENAVKKAIEEKAQFIKIPTEEMEFINKIKNCINLLSEGLGRNPTLDEISKDIYLPVDRVKRVIGVWKLQNVRLLPRKEMINQMRLDTTVVGFEAKESEIELASTRENIQQVILTLTCIERNVLEMRFGLKDGYSHTLEEVGRRFQATRERIIQIEAKALRKMRHPTRIRKLEGLIELPGA
jgi:RNA polymerase primary sigma factor